jgi:hypothetical protein
VALIVFFVLVCVTSLAAIMFLICGIYMRNPQYMKLLSSSCYILWFLAFIGFVVSLVLAFAIPGIYMGCKPI